MEVVIIVVNMWHFKFYPNKRYRLQPQNYKNNLIYRMWLTFLTENTIILEAMIKQIVLAECNKNILNNHRLLNNS